MPPSLPHRRTLLTMLLRIAAGWFADDPELFRRIAARRDGSSTGADGTPADVEVRWGSLVRLRYVQKQLILRTIVCATPPSLSMTA